MSKLIPALASLIESRSRRMPRNAATIGERGIGLDHVPEVTEISGLVVSADDVLDRARVDVQYRSHDREFIEMKMPFLEAARLHGYLHGAMRNPKLAPLVDLALEILHGPSKGRNK